MPPIKKGDDSEISSRILYDNKGGGASPAVGGCGFVLPPELEGNELLKNIEPRLIELIINEVSMLISYFSSFVPNTYLTPSILLSLPPLLDYGSWFSSGLGRYCWT